MIPKALLLDLDGTLVDEQTSGSSHVLFRDALPFVEQARAAGIPIAIVSNGHPDAQTVKVKVTGLEERIQALIVSESVGFRKPRKEIFLLATEALGAAPEDCLMIGDRPEADYEGALGAGMQAIWLDRVGAGPRPRLRRIESLAWPDSFRR